MKQKRILSGVMLLMLFFGCTHKGSISQSLVETTNPHSVSSSIVYTGKLSCDDCNGIQAMITFTGDSTFVMETLKSEDDAEVEKTEGSYTLILKKHMLSLHPGKKEQSIIYFKLDDQRLIQTNSRGNPLLRNEMENHILIRSDHQILEKKWKLVELKGKPIILPQNANKEPYMVLKALQKRVLGNGGCNGFSGIIELPKGNTIRISRIISTKMACMEIDFENDFFNVLEDIDTYSVITDTLMISQGELRPLAKFIIIDRE